MTAKTKVEPKVAVVVSRAGAIRARPSDILKASGVKQQLDSIKKIRLAVEQGK
jgi:hypothetical protein